MSHYRKYGPYCMAESKLGKAHLVKKLSHAFELLSVHMKTNSEMLKTLVDVQENKALGSK